MKLYFLILVQILLISCGSHESNIVNHSANQNESSTDVNAVEENDKEGNINDGTYNAEVDYYNPNTGTSNSYNLTVDIVDNSVTVIHFYNGGWIDETHIVSGGELVDGETKIITDKGYEYIIKIDK